ncbi:helix-turn-helix domain-containing protein [Streptomyces spiralis]
MGRPLRRQRLPRRNSMPNQLKPGVEAAFLNVQNAARYMGISVNTLYVWRHRRQGPPSFRMGPGGRVMYRRDLLDAWLSEQEQADSRSNPALNPMNKAPRQRERHRAR